MQRRGIARRTNLLQRLRVTLGGEDPLRMAPSKSSRWLTANSSGVGEAPEDRRLFLMQGIDEDRTDDVIGIGRGIEPDEQPSDRRAART